MIDKKHKIFRYIAYALEIILLFIIQTTPGFLPIIAGSKGILLIPAVLTIAFFEEEVPALFFGLAGGVVLDLSASNNVGFYAFILTLVCFVVSRIFRDYMVVSFLNSLAFSALIITVIILVYFLFFYVMAGKPEAGYYFTHHYISKIIYTICFVPIFYGINRFLFKNLR